MTRRPVIAPAPASQAAAPPQREVQGKGTTEGSKGAAAADGVQREIAKYLKTAEEMINTIKKDLAASREQNQALIHERNELLKQLLALESSRVDSTTAQEEQLQLKADRDLLKKELRDFRKEIEQLYSRYALMEAALAEEREKNVQAQAEISCLEEQVQQLNSIVDLMTIKLQLGGGSPESGS